MMRHPLDFTIYGVHAAFWLAFAITHRFAGVGRATPVGAPTTSASRTAGHSRLVLSVHFVAFGILYLGIGNAVFGTGVARWFPGQRVVGAAVIGVGAWLMCWSLLYFRSWRFRAKLDAGHELATGGPYACVRHPIYVGMNLLALGTAVWMPAALLWVAVAIMLLGSDLRGRAEEQLLTEAFGKEYVSYCARTKRFVPWVY